MIKIGRNLLSGLGGDSVKDRQMDGQTDGSINNIPIAFLKKCVDNNIGIP